MVPTVKTNPDTPLADLFAAEGVAFLGIADSAPLPEERDEAEARYHRWLAEGHQGTMSYLERHAAAKYDPNLVLPGTRSVLVCGLGYLQPRPEPVPGTGLVAKYAWGRDYHKILLKKLQRVADRLSAAWPGEQWKSFTDTAPLDERWWAERAGASFTAKNTLAINRTLGSWFVLGEILTTKVFTPTKPVSHQHGQCPSGCHRCQDVCPTGALDADGRIDAKTCISYLTIEHRGPIDEALKPAIGGWLFGCDLCQEVCPFNLKVAPTKETEFLAWKAGPHLDLEEILLLKAAEFTVRFGGSPVHRAGRNGLVRNACIVAANLNRTELLPLMANLASDPDPGVTDAARWAQNRLGIKVAL